MIYYMSLVRIPVHMTRFSGLVQAMQCLSVMPLPTDRWPSRNREPFSLASVIDFEKCVRRGTDTSPPDINTTAFNGDVVTGHIDVSIFFQKTTSSNYCHSCFSNTPDGWLGVFYGIITFRGYLTPNPFLYK